MKANKLLLTTVALGAIIASSAMAQTAGARTTAMGRTSSSSTLKTSTNHWANHNWGNHRHHRSHSRIFFDVGFGYPFGYGYPYYGYYPYGYGYGYGYYGGPREVVYQAATTNRSIVVEVQRCLARAGYYRGAIDGVIGNGTRSAIRSYERAHGLRVDGQIDQRLLATMGLA